MNLHHVLTYNGKRSLESCSLASRGSISDAHDLMISWKQLTFKFTSIISKFMTFQMIMNLHNVMTCQQNYDISGDNEFTECAEFTMANQSYNLVDWHQRRHFIC